MFRCTFLNQAFALVWIVLLASCATRRVQDNPHSELVMTPGMVIEATNSQGTMRIEYVDKYTRRYLWDEQTKTFRHQPRDTRWFGSLGMYRPYGDGTMHAILQEGQMPFQNTAEAYAWLKKFGLFMDYVWTKDGLVVGWKQQGRPGDGYLALSVEVWQILIKGKKPTSLKGAEDKKIRVTPHQAEPPHPASQPKPGA